MAKRLKSAFRRAVLHALDPTCRHMPLGTVMSLFGRCTADLEVTLCLHRVDDFVRETDPLPHQTVRPGSMDAFLELATEARRRGGGPEKLVLTFDDGYRDAVDYVRTRAHLHPDVEWIVFVCPEKLQTRAGFRWDLWEEDPRSRQEPIRLEAMQEDVDPLRENSRDELRALADRAEYLLATVEECQDLLSIPNVKLGNHTNSHAALARLDEAAARMEIQSSTRAFNDMFGECLHFAFPFGVPGRDFRRCDVQAVRELAPSATIWTCVQRPYWPYERQPGAVLPRMAAPGQWSEKSLATWLAMLGIREHLRSKASLEQSSRRSPPKDQPVSGQDEQRSASAGSSGGS